TAKIEVRDKNPVAALQTFLAQVLEDEYVAGVLAPRHLNDNGALMPTLVTDPAMLDRVDPLAPAFPFNAAKTLVKLTNGEMVNKVAAVLKPCEIRAFVELVKLNQGNMDNALLIGVDCLGSFGNTEYLNYVKDADPIASSQDFARAALAGEESPGGTPIAKACMACEHPSAVQADLSIGLVGLDIDDHLVVSAHTARGEGLLSRLGLPDVAEAPSRAKAMAELVKKRTAFRDKMFEETNEATASVEKLARYLSGCVNCYNCRVACPVCYCKECVFVTDVFDHKPWQYLDWAGNKGMLKMPTDTVFYHLTRLAHMSTACVGCGQCSNACPNDIPVMELFRTVAARTQAAFGYEAGKSTDDAPPLSVFQEKEFSEVTGGVD
ncbi:MAG: Coenzyme F420 hydrogenase/dehydrogenase, beta subunit C-terminal domain, partial [Desulfovibrionaceae bacterium]|nr:Coenzyme F420 hydrogenase/dehydrogenase, beta subunit C-terminal domain [Desulfovibrionaceae bacterium]